jgi:hypothetical protein
VFKGRDSKVKPSALTSRVPSPDHPHISSFL